jgi:predicted esterase
MKHLLAVFLSLPALPSLAEPIWFHYRNPAASDVSVAGEFNGWDRTADPLVAGDDGTWTLAKDIPAGTYGYKFVVDEEWILDPGNPKKTEIGGVENSLLDTSDPYFAEPVDLSVPRTWTARSGARREARLAEVADGIAVLEKADGKKVRIAVEQLSEADQRLLSPPAAPEAPPSGPGASPIVAPPASTVHVAGARGLIDAYSLTARIFEKPSDYFKGPTRRNMERWYTNRDRFEGDFKKGAYDPDAPLEYDVAGETASVYVPDAYDGTTNWGLLVHLDPGTGAAIPDDWKAVMAKHRLIYASPHGAEDGQPDMKRIGLALDTVATLRKEYVINTNRVVISGLSDGARIAFHTALVYPELFCGAISHAAPFHLNGHVQFMTMPEIAKVARRHARWAIVGGEEDEGHKGLVASAEAWQDTKFDFRFFDIPGMGRHRASGEALDTVLTWMDGEL